MMMDLSFQHRLITAGREFLLDIRLKEKASRIALYGPSGSGKTLTAHAIAGLLRPDQGYIRLNGLTFFNAQDRIWMPPRRRQLAYLQQDYGLFPHLTVAQNIGFGLKTGWLNMSRKAMLPEAAQRWVEAFDLNPILASYPHEISGGQKQRVALARALCTKPRLLLLDEPLAALDVTLRRKMRQELMALQQQLDIPTILITHDLEDAVALADQVYLVANGKITGHETPRQLAGIQSSVPSITLEALNTA